MFVGLDVHKQTIDVSIAEADRQAEAALRCNCGDLKPLDEPVRALRARTGDSFVNQAGPVRFRDLPGPEDVGEDCAVVRLFDGAKMKRRSAEEDLRDSLHARAVASRRRVRAIYVPDDTDERCGVRRAGEDAVVVGTQANGR